MVGPVVARKARDEDFELFPEMIRNYIRAGKPGEASDIPFRIMADDLRQSFSADGQDGIRGELYVAEDGDGPCAMMGVYVTPESNGSLAVPGFRDAVDPEVARPLLSKCEGLIRSLGGSRISAHASLEAGSVRSRDLAFFEALGFVSDDHFYDLSKLAMKDWVGPALFTEDDAATIRVASAEEEAWALTKAKEQGDDDYAASNNSSAPPSDSPKKVTVLHSPDGGEPAAFAYFELVRFTDGEYVDAVMACGLSLHFCTEASPCQRRRFVEGVLSSIKQLGVAFIWAEQSSRDYATYVELLRQGFDATGPWQVRLTKEL